MLGVVLLGLSDSFMKSVLGDESFLRVAVAITYLLLLRLLAEKFGKP
jgi:hypothetical protein